MDEKQAWQLFARTGKIEDYIRYTQIKNQAGGLCPPAGEAYGESNDPGAHHPGAGVPALCCRSVQVNDKTVKAKIWGVAALSERLVQSHSMAGGRWCTKAFP